MRQIKYLLVVVILIRTSSVYSQEKEKTNFWLNAGIGFNSLSLGGNINANFRINAVQITARIGGYAQGIFGSTMEEYALLAGYNSNAENSHFSITGGLSNVKYVQSSGYFAKTKETTAFGLALELQYCYTIWKFLGLGATLNANSNSVRTVIGVNLNLFIGDLDW